MSTLPKPADDFEMTPAGTHHAVCYQVIDLGTQESPFGKKHQINIAWELSDELMRDGRPFSVRKFYTWSTHQNATLRHHLEQWRGQPFTDKDFGPTGFNIKNILGKCCTLNVVHEDKNGKMRSQVANVGKVMKGHEQKPPLNPCIYLWLEDGLWDANIYKLLSEWLQSTIAKSPEYQSIISGKPIEQATDERNPPSDLDDEIPF